MGTQLPPKYPPIRASVVRPWLNQLSYKMQATVLAITRGCDGIPKHDVSKTITRALRGLFLHRAESNPTSFHQQVSRDELVQCIERFVANCDHYPLHFVQHLMMAAHVIAVRYPNAHVAAPWRHLYRSLCDALHVVPEDDLDMEVRLMDEVGCTPHSPTDDDDPGARSAHRRR